MGRLGLRIVDSSDPANPQEVGLSDTEGTAEAVQISGSYAYLADGETAYGYSTSQTRLTRRRSVSIIHSPSDMPKTYTSQEDILSWQTT